ncbi:MFS transporter [bacterium]|nr:MFS transporter [bacterium]
MPESSAPPLSRYRWIIVSLLFFATTNNYFNRIVLSVVIPEIKRDLSLNDIQYSYVLSAFQFAYTFGFLFIGRFIDWAGTKLGYLLSILFWSLAASLHATVGSAFSLAVWRGLLGVTETGNFPAAIKSVSEWFPPRERAFATALFNSGPHIAMVAGAPVIALLTLSLGWRWAFFLLGFSGFILAAVWPFLYKKPPDTASKTREKPAATVNEFTWRKLLGYRETYGIMLGKFLTDPVWWFYIFWLPNYLNARRGFDLKEIAAAVPLIYFIAILFGIAAGWFPGYLMRKGWTVTRARKTTMLVCALCLPFTTFAVTADSAWVAILLVSLACGAHSGWSNNIFTVVSDQFPSRAVGSVTGLGGFAGGIGGLLFSTVLVGYIVTYIGYVPIFILMGVLHPAAMLCIHLLIKKEHAGMA